MPAVSVRAGGGGHPVHPEVPAPSRGVLDHGGRVAEVVLRVVGDRLDVLQQRLSVPRNGTGGRLRKRIGPAGSPAATRSQQQHGGRHLAVAWLGCTAACLS